MFLQIFFQEFFEKFVQGLLLLTGGSPGIPFWNSSEIPSDILRRDFCLNLPNLFSDFALMIFSKDFFRNFSGNISIVSFKISAPRISLNISFRDCFRNSSSTSEIVFGMSQEFFKEFLLTNKWTASETHPWSSVEVPPGSPSVIHLKISPEIPRKVSLENLWVSTEIPPEILFKYPFGNHSEISLHWFVHKLFQDYLQNSSRSYFRHFLRLF